MWSESTSLLPKLHVTSIGSIEDEGAGMMELDFANKLVCLYFCKLQTIEIQKPNPIKN